MQSGAGIVPVLLGDWTWISVSRGRLGIVWCRDNGSPAGMGCSRLCRTAIEADELVGMRLAPYVSNARLSHEGASRWCV